MMKPELHFRFPDEKRFCEMLIDLCETVRPDLVLVDAIDSMQGDGPSGGSKIHTGMILAGKSPYEIDLLLCKIAGFNPEKIHTISASQKRGLSVSSVDELKLVGDEVKFFPEFIKPVQRGVDFSAFLPSWFPKSIINHFSSRPQIIKKAVSAAENVQKAVRRIRLKFQTEKQKSIMTVASAAFAVMRCVR